MKGDGFPSGAHAGAPVVEVDALTVRYRAGVRGGHTAVDGVSLRVEGGEIVGVVGESGSGKTTLGMAVAGLGPRTSGTIRVLGRDLAALRPAELRRLRPEVQVIFQDPHGSLDPRQSVRSGLRELRALQPERTGWIDDAELMAQVRLAPDLLGRMPHQLSGGQAQRVCIARALLMRPKLLVADEPTSGLDVSVQAEVLGLLMRLRETTGVSVLFVSHDLSVVRRICDRVYVMLHGRVVEEGPAARVLEAPVEDYTRRLVAAVPGRRLRAAHAARPLGRLT
ncbi:dipeptide/oligopeptide/nickel ABC transporter ATP-binding protein [Actinocorallia sp. A-T 12471]|uniref:ABC transporter ATP-binding protein n=1 Tax=Actinocorallia sp. A-T 12471 TaxID=3089813 RepID=UPI0029D38F90|nr:dipeptide/oligopeptide/nickel ABC transporter ATP-binding protein [Actinocorallia sp. A-T 12471]MDX6739453.1 dipeptide/oligopeptide/nickel ABC transporter ATP-binding protein [Actinocorallia sp. A-T 12471]